MILKVSVGAGVKALDWIASIPSSDRLPPTTRWSNWVSWVVPVISSWSVPPGPWV